MKQQRNDMVLRSLVGLAALGIAVLGTGAVADPAGGGADSHDLLWLGHADLQGRTAYQPTLHTINGKVYLFVGHFSGQLALNPLTGVVEPNGTTITDVSNPAHPNTVFHIPSTNGSQMVRVCDGQTGVLGQTGKVYMLRNTGNTHEVWDVTTPSSPSRLSVIQPAPGAFFTNTHKNWWECDTGVAYLVAGAGAAAAAPDGWTTNQHVKVYDLTDPANPQAIRDIGLVGQNPGSSVRTATSGVHGPISVRNNPITGEAVNRIYIPYGTSSNGVFQIVDRLKVLPAKFGGTWDGSDPFAPTDAELQALVVGSMDMTPTEGAHTSFPIYGVPLTHYQGFTSNNTRDLVALISEETDNHCLGSPHFGYLVDATRAKGAGGVCRRKPSDGDLDDAGAGGFSEARLLHARHALRHALDQRVVLRAVLWEAAVRRLFRRRPARLRHPRSLPYAGGRALHPAGQRQHAADDGDDRRRPADVFDVSTDNAELDDHGSSTSSIAWAAAPTSCSSTAARSRSSTRAKVCNGKDD
jgi:hypothetical protein